ncbi:uncharacterized protein [Choristoneura fumiferana]|uniref:uncharacterized protein n=1 Tax=Choristoneura fumiferana TaxID=7141 RepID=UPI003D1591A4
MQLITKQKLYVQFVYPLFKTLTNNLFYSDIIDSNELSNETDLFACDKSSISSSEPERQPDRYININNNEEPKKKAVVVCKRPRKRFRKRVKKRQPAAERSDSDASSDSALPLSRMVVDPTARPEPEGEVMGVPNIIIITKGTLTLTLMVMPQATPYADSDSDGDASSDSALPLSRMVVDPTARPEPEGEVMGVPNIIIITKDFKPRIKTPDRKPSKQATDKTKAIDNTAKAKAIDKTTDKAKAVDKTTDKIDEASGDAKEKVDLDLRSCDECSLSFRGERGLRRHMNMTHFTPTNKYQQGANPF